MASPELQKVALARDFFRDAQLMVMDEPTSALNAMAEHEIFQNFREHVAGRAAVIISHRLSTIRLTDTIYVWIRGALSNTARMRT